MKVSEIQTAIFEQTGLKTSAKRNKGSMKHHYTIWPIYQGGKYPDFPFAWLREFSKQFNSFGQGVFCTVSSLDIPANNFTDFDPIQYKKEHKPKPVDPDKPMSGWGSKNSQLRVDKATARHAKAVTQGKNTVRFY